MSKKKILTVGFELASAQTEYADFGSKPSLLDWDIVLVKPQTDLVFSYNHLYRGKPRLKGTASFQFTESCEHWRREIKQVVDAGKTVIAFATELQEVYVDTGERSYSGTGRNQKTTVHVEECDNYRSIPAELNPQKSIGSAMKLSARGARVLGPYWEEFKKDSKYHVVLAAADVPDCIVTRTGDRPVGAIYRSKSSPGSLLVLPDIDFYPKRFLREQGGDTEWTGKAEQFAERMVAAIVALDSTLRGQGEITPVPGWASAEEFVLDPERAIGAQLLEAERRLVQAQKQKEELAEQMSAAGELRALLFEKGIRLERAIIAALQLLGFSANALKNAYSEFDVVFESNEGRFIGEAEGKDNRAVNVEKLRQLSMNVQEDLESEDVSSPAKPVLFGNAFRLQPLDERGEPFTEKCEKAALMSSTGLVFTPDLFFVTQYLLSRDDDQYAHECRKALLNHVGRVAFPKPPDTIGSEEIIAEEDGLERG